jgi:hypothetical protein
MSLAGEGFFMRNFGGYWLAVRALILTSLCFATSANAALVFNFTFIAGTSAAVQSGFNAAAARWSSVFNDNVTLNMTVGSGALGGNVLAQAGSSVSLYSYSAVRTALTNDRTSLSDFTAVANLQAGSNVAMLINHTSDNPNGANSATPYLDTTGQNNSNLILTTANAKALGLSGGPTGNVSGCTGSCDAFIEFSNTINFDFDSSDGIAFNAYDFVGIATHELGHALGFTSGVDELDAAPGGSANSYRDLTTLDLFRYSAQSVAQNAIDFTADQRAKYFSIDGGASIVAAFSTGVALGDGNQASHWKDGLNLGIMDPTASNGESLAISGNDVLALDVIGWNRVAQTPVPEPSGWAMMMAGFAAIGASLRSRAAVKKYAGA